MIEKGRGKKTSEEGDEMRTGGVPKGPGTIPVRLSAVRTSAVLLQSRIRSYASIGTFCQQLTPGTDPGCELSWGRA